MEKPPQPEWESRQLLIPDELPPENPCQTFLIPPWKPWPEAPRQQAQSTKPSEPK